MSAGDLRDLRPGGELELVAGDARSGDLADDGRLDAEVRERADEQLRRAGALLGRRSARGLGTPQDRAVGQPVLGRRRLADVEERLLRVLGDRVQVGDEHRVGLVGVLLRRDDVREVVHRVHEHGRRACVGFAPGLATDLLPGCRRRGARRRSRAERPTTRTAWCERRRIAPTEAPVSRSTPARSVKTPRIITPGRADRAAEDGVEPAAVPAAVVAAEDESRARAPWPRGRAGRDGSRRGCCARASVRPRRRARRAARRRRRRGGRASCAPSQAPAVPPFQPPRGRRRGRRRARRARARRAPAVMAREPAARRVRFLRMRAGARGRSFLGRFLRAMRRVRRGASPFPACRPRSSRSQPSRWHRLSASFVQGVSCSPMTPNLSPSAREPLDEEVDEAVPVDVHAHVCVRLPAGPAPQVDVRCGRARARRRCRRPRRGPRSRRGRRGSRARRRRRRAPASRPSRTAPSGSAGRRRRARRRASRCGPWRPGAPSRAGRNSALWVTSSPIMVRSIPLANTRAAASGSAQMLNSAAGVTLPSAIAPPMSTIRSSRSATSGWRASSSPTFVSGPVGTRTTPGSIRSARKSTACCSTGCVCGSGRSGPSMPLSPWTWAAT